MGTMSPLDNLSVCEIEISEIDKLDGNASVISETNVRAKYNGRTMSSQNYKVKNASVAHHLPVVTVCNMRSFFPKVKNFKNDFFVLFEN